MVYLCQIMYKLQMKRLCVPACLLRILWELTKFSWHLYHLPIRPRIPTSSAAEAEKQLQWHHNLVDESGRKKEKQNTENFDNHFVLPKSCCQCFHSWQTRTMYLSNKANLNKIENSKIFKRTTITSNAVPPNALKFHRSIKETHLKVT